MKVKLNYLDCWNEGRRAAACRYDQLLSKLPVTRPCEAPGVHHVYHQYTIRTPQRDRLAGHLKERDVSTMVYYPTPLHRQGLYSSLSCAKGSLPVSEAVSREVLSLPMFPELDETRQRLIAQAIGEFYGQS